MPDSNQVTDVSRPDRYEVDRYKPAAASASEHAARLGKGAYREPPTRDDG